MAPSTLLSLLFTISMIFISHAISPTASPKSSPKLYETICKSIGESLKNNEQPCLKLLESNPQIPSAKDYLTLSRLVLDLAIEKATKGQNYLKSLTNKYPTSQALKGCATKFYNYLISGFRTGMRELATDPDEASWDVSTGSEGPDWCQQSLDQEKIVNDSSISILNNEMKFLCFIAVETIAHVQQ
jgi:pectinesterase inhibitor-like protein